MAKVTQNAFGISLKKKKNENNSSVSKEHTTNKSWKTFALSFKDFKKKKKISWLAETRMSPVIVQQTLYKKYRTSAHS